MESLFSEVNLHASLGRTIRHLGGERFWRQLLLLLQQWVPFSNALAAFYPATGTPLALEEYGEDLAQPGPAAMELYLGGLYQLDPFCLACREGLADGFHRLEEVAPDDFRQSEYFLSYFRDVVQQDEVQFVLQLPQEGTLSLSLGMGRLFSHSECGLLTMISPWLLALMQQHWQRSQPLQPVRRLDSQVQDALTHFGAGVLSEREREIAHLVLRGYSGKAMAERLSISPETVKVHRRHLYAKLDIASQQELFSLFIQSLGHDPQHP